MTRQEYEAHLKEKRGIGKTETNKETVSESRKEYERTVKAKYADSAKEKIESGVTSALKNSNSLFSSYNDRYKNGNSTWRDSSDTSAWTSNVTKSRSAIDSDYAKVNKLLDTYGDVLDEDWVGNVRSTLEGNKTYLDQVTDTAKAEQDYFGQWQDADSYKRSVNREKYKDSSFDEVMKAAEETDDERERDWLKNYAITKDYKDEAEYDKVIAEAERQQHAYAQEHPTMSASVPYQYRDKDARDEFDNYSKIIDSLKAKKTLAERQKTVDDHMSVTENPDFIRTQANRIYYTPTYKETNEGTASITDKLGTYMSARESGEDYYNNLDDPNEAWSSLMREGEANRWDLLTKEEQDIYYYYLNKEGQEKAYKFLEDMAPTLGQREQEEQHGKLEDASGLEMIFHNIASIPANVFGGVTGFLTDTVDTLSGKSINPYGAGHRLTNYASNVREQTAEDIEKHAGQLISNSYQAVMSGADSLLGAATMGAGYTITMGMGAATQKAKELYEAGASDGQIALGGLVSGAIEVVTEKLGYDTLSEKFWNQNKTVKALLASMLAEGGEEVTADVLNMATDALIQGYNSPHQQRIRELIDGGMTEVEAKVAASKENAVNTFWSFYGGALSGGILGGGGALLGFGEQAIEEHKATQEARELVGGAINEAEQTQKLIETAKQSEDKSIRKMAENLGAQNTEKMSERQKSVYDRSVGRLYEKMANAEKLKAEPKTNKNGKTTQVSTGNEVSVSEIASIKDGEVSLRLSNGSVVDASDVAHGNKDVAEIYARIGNMGMDTESANAVVRAYDDKTALSGADYLSGMREGFRYGQVGQTFDTIQSRGYFSDLTESQKRLAYNLGRASASADVSARQSAIDARAKTDTAKHGKVFMDGINAETLTNRQKTSVDVLSKVVGMTGNNIHFYESVQGEGGRVLQSDVGKYKAGDVAPNGFYQSGTGDIYIDINAGNNGEGVILWTASHEFAHFVRENAPTEFHALSEFLSEQYSEKGTDIESLVVSKMAQSREEISHDSAFEEVVADSLQTMFTDTNLAEKIATLKQKNTSLWQKVKDFFHNLYEKLKSLYDGLDAQTEEARQVREMKDSIEHISDLFAEGIVKAGENFQTTVNERYMNASDTAAEKSVISEIGDNLENVIRDKDGNFLVATTKDGSEFRYSERTYNDKGRNALRNALVKRGYSAQDANDTLSYIDDRLETMKAYGQEYAEDGHFFPALLEHLGRDVGRSKNDKSGKLNRQMIYSFVKNGDYPANIDLQLNCKKRITYGRIMETLINDGIMENIKYDGNAIAAINQILRENEFETACLGCFVESRRLQFQTWAETFVSEWNETVEKQNPNADYFFGNGSKETEKVKTEDVLSAESKLVTAKKNAQGNYNLGSGNTLAKMERLVKIDPAKFAHKLSVADLITPEGLDRVRTDIGSDIFSLLRMRYGAGAPKYLQGYNPYNSEIIDLTFNKIKEMTGGAGAKTYYEKQARAELKKSGEFDKMSKSEQNDKIAQMAISKYLYDIGGIRIQSFSDFMVENTFDMLQIFADMSAMGFPTHGYTKELSCIRLFGMNGSKWNGSLISHVEPTTGMTESEIERAKDTAGLMPYTEENARHGITVELDGKKYVIQFDDYERHTRTGSYIQSIGYKDIIATMIDPRYSANVGNITIGLSDAHIRAMLRSPLFRMVIPYHKSGMLEAFAKVVGIDVYNDYQDTQSTTVKEAYDHDGNLIEVEKGKLKRGSVDTHYDFNAELQRTGDAKQAADNYIAWCADSRLHPIYEGKGKNKTLIGYATLAPKFEKFTDEANYYKVLEDFNVYDTAEEIRSGKKVNTRQEAVTMRYPGDGNGGTLSAEQLAQYREDLINTGIFTDAEVEKYVQKAQMTFDEIVKAELETRNAYNKAQEPKYQSAVDEIKRELSKEQYKRTERADTASEYYASKKGSVAQKKPPEGTYKNSERTTNSTDARTILSEYDISKATGERKKLLSTYQNKFKTLQSKQAELSKIRNKMVFNTNQDELIKLTNQSKALKDSIGRLDASLTKMEMKTPAFKQIVSEQSQEIKKLTKQRNDAYAELERDVKRSEKQTKREERLKGEIEDLKKKSKDRADRDAYIRWWEKTEAKKEQKQKIADVRTAYERRNLLQTFKGEYQELSGLLLNGDEHHHVPFALRSDVADALSAFDVRTRNYEQEIAKIDKRVESAKTEEERDKLIARRYELEQKMLNQSADMKELATVYGSIGRSTDAIQQNAYDSEIQQAIQEFISDTGGKPLSDMSNEEIKKAVQLIRMVRHTVANANKTFKAERSKMVSECATDTMKEIKYVVGKKMVNDNKYAYALRRFDWNNMKPIYAIKTIGSGTLEELFDNIMKGEGVWANDLNEAHQYSEDQKKKYGYNKWDFKTRHEFTSASGIKFDLNLQEMMSIYAFSRREQAQAHLAEGGFVFESETKNTADAHTVPLEIQQKIVSTLTEDQQQFTIAMQRYLSEVMGEKGNEVSRALYDIEQFGEKNYFPLVSAKQYIPESDKPAGERQRKHSGFTKALVKGANNPVVLRGFMDVWSSHVNEMSEYHAYVLPLEDFTRVFNFRDKSAGESTKSVIQNAYGKQALDYIHQMLVDVNGGTRSDIRSGTFVKLTSMMKKGATFASLSVAIQQPSAIVRAFAYINPKYFFKAIPEAWNFKKHNALWEECKHYAPVAVIKDMGFFDIGNGRKTEEWLQSGDYERTKEKLYAMLHDGNYRDDVLSKLPALMDELTWTNIWEATKKEIASKEPNLKVGSEEFLQRCGERFTEVINLTQVYDSTLSRSSFMRSKDELVKSATAFMAEPTTNINMLRYAIVKYGRDKDKKALWGTIGSLIGATLLNELLKSIVYAARDDDDNKSYLEKYAKTVVGEFKEDFVFPGFVAGQIPLIKDIASIIQGYDVERLDTAVISDIYKAFNKLSSDNVSTWRKVEDFAGSVSNLAGIPIGNIMRDMRSVYNVFTSDSKIENLGKAISEGWTGDTYIKQDKERLSNAIESGKSYDIKLAVSEVMKDRREDGKTDEEARAYVQNALTSEWKPKFIAAYQSNDRATMAKIRSALLASGVYKKDIVTVTNKWIKDID